MEGLGSRFAYHQHFAYLDATFPLICALVTLACASIRLLCTNNVPSDGLTHVFRHRTPLWLMQLALVVLRILIAFSMEHLVELNLILPICVLVAVILDNYSLSVSTIKVRCWLVLYSIVLLFTVKEAVYLPSPIRICSMLCSVVVLALSVARSTFAFEEVLSSPPSPEYTANLLLYLSFAYLNKTLFAPALSKRCINAEDVPLLTDFDSSEYLWRVYQARRRDKSSLLVNIVRVVFMGALHNGLFAVVGSMLVFVAPLALERILWHISKEGDDGVEAVLPFGIEAALFMLLAGPALTGVFDNLTYCHGRHLGVRVRAIIQCVAYQKLLRVDGGVMGDGMGRVNSIFSSDGNHINSFACYWSELLTMPLQIVVCVYLLYRVLGVAAFGGVAVMGVALPIGSFISDRLRIVYKAFSAASDARMSIMNEVLQGMRVVKLFAWENQFLRMIVGARTVEVRELKRCLYAEACMESLWTVVLPVVTVVSYLLHTETFHQIVTPAAGFTALTLFNILRYPLTSLPSTIKNTVRAYISLKRIEAFLDTSQVDRIVLACDDAPRDFAMVIEGASFAWRPADMDSSNESDSLCSFLGSCESRSMQLGAYERVVTADREEGGSETTHESASEAFAVEPTLRDVTVRLAKGSLTVVVGMTGSGKSTFLHGILGECALVSGSLHFYCSRISYVSQSSFIQSGSLRDNILFGEAFEEIRYRQVIFACALEKDLEILSHGDQTQIGEKGVNLSGGQQQRVNLARAAYSRSELIIMDDPLSAVDAAVGEHIFEHLILGLLSDRTRLLVSHQLALTLPHSDSVLFIDPDGKVTQSCLRDLSEVVSGVSAKDDTAGHFVTMIRELAKSTKAESYVPSLNARGDRQCNLVLDSPLENDASMLILRETKAEGDVRWQIYQYYIRACGGFAIGAGLSMLQLVKSVIDVGQNVLLGRWMTQMENSEPGQRLTVTWFLVFVVGGSAIGIIAAFAQANIAVVASQRMHDVMTLRVLRGPMAWFESTPIGRVLNRFSGDMKTVDGDMLESLMSLLKCALGGLQVLVVVSVSLPVLLLLLAPLFLVASWVIYQYLVVSRDLKRLESVSRSPILVHVSETYLGLSTLRAFGQEDVFFTSLFKKIDTFSRMHLYLWLSNRWLNLRMGLLGAIVVGGTGIAIVVGGEISGSSAGMALLYSLALTENLTWIARTYADCQMNLNSVERIKEYSEIAQERQPAGSSVEQSGVQKIGDAIVLDELHAQEENQSWPSLGVLEFRDVCMSYQTSQNVLRNVSFSAAECEKVGIVGRTGAGKSSLLAALFRIVEPSSGQILIDGVNVLELSLQLLRSRIAIVPQDPVLFKGSVRSNLDPFSTATDLDLWNALRRVKLAEFIKSLPGESLDTKLVAEKGSNLSVGQRQLLCMARAVAKKCRIIVMDEATASVDHETDGMIQDAIRYELNDCTVLCVAHRLRTIAFYDRVIVMDKGSVAEVGRPSDLMQIEGSLFRSMCMSSGDFDDLLRIAQGGR